MDFIKDKIKEMKQTLVFLNKNLKSVERELDLHEVIKLEQEIKKNDD